MTKVLQRMKKSLCLVLSLVIMLSATVVGLTAQTAKATGGTGAGLASWAWRAYNEGWSYVWGGASPGAVDCSGLICSYAGGAHNSEAMIAAAPASGSISSIPEIPGLGLYMPGHIGVYVGGGMCIDARTESVGVCCASIGYMGWTSWFYVAGLSYDSAGEGYYYEEPVYEEPVYEEPTYYAQSNNNTGNTSNSGNTATQQTTNQSNNTASQAVVVAPTNDVLKMGSTGEAVQALQTRLGELNFYQGTDSGYFGEYTEQCLKNFQATAGLDATGIADADTLYIMSLGDAPTYKPPVFTLGMSYSEITPMQTKLNQLDYLSAGSINGTFDEATYDAVKKFQQAMGLSVTGEIDEATQTALFSDNAKSNPYVSEASKGSTGETVANLQAKLVSLRYLTGDYTIGTFDESTEKALRDFQSVNGLTVTGTLSRGDKELLYSEKAQKSREAENLQLGYSGSDVSMLQSKLASLGYYEGEISGIYDQATEKAVRAFERENGLTETGIATLAVRVVIDAEINSGKFKKTSNSGYAVSGLTNNELAPKTTNVALVVVNVIIALLATALVAFIITRKLKKAKANR